MSCVGGNDGDGDVDEVDERGMACSFAGGGVGRLDSGT